MKYVIAIDPSINNVGCAVFKMVGKKSATLIDKDVLHPSKFVKNGTYLEKARDIVEQIREVIEKLSKKGIDYDGNNDVQLVTEIPQHFGVSGYLARESGAILKLTFIAGMIYNITDNVVSYEPNQWKGQLPKDVVARRLQKLYKDLDIYDMKNNKFLMDHNIVDACAIGHFYIYGKL